MPILKADQAQLREFKGVTFQLLAVGEKSMITKMLYKNGDQVPSHSHPNEQSGYVVSGKYRLVFQGFDEIIQSGDSYAIPANVAHSLTVIEAGEVIDVFTPARQDYL